MARKLVVIAKRDAIGSDLEGGFGACEEGEVAKVGVAYGEVKADGEVVVLHIFMEHRVHIVEAVLWMLVLVELSHDDASNM